MGSYNFVVFEKFIRAYLHQISLEIMLFPTQVFCCNEVILIPMELISYFLSWTDSIAIIYQINFKQNIFTSLTH